MQRLVGHARDRAKNRKAKNDPRGGDSDFDLSFDYLIEMYHKQEGRCAYSCMPFDFGTQHYRPSLERKDPTQPYTKDNVCLIWMILNTTDNIVTTKHFIEPGEVQGWTKEKFEYAFQHILAKTKRELEEAPAA